MFEYEIDADRFLRIASPAFGEVTLSAAVLRFPKRSNRHVATGRSRGLGAIAVQSMEAAGRANRNGNSRRRNLSGEIDFHTELQPGDRFALAFERFTREGALQRMATLRAAGFRMTAVSFAPSASRARRKPAYLTSRGALFGVSCLHRR